MESRGFTKTTIQILQSEGIENKNILKCLRKEHVSAMQMKLKIGQHAMLLSWWETIAKKVSQSLCINEHLYLNYSFLTHAKNHSADSASNSSLPFAMTKPRSTKQGTPHFTLPCEHSRSPLLFPVSPASYFSSVSSSRSSTLSRLVQLADDNDIDR